MICRMDFDMFFGILILDPKSRFCMGYSLCMMVDFQNGLIFPKSGKEMRDAPSALLCYIRTLEFLRTRKRFRKVCAEGECFPHVSSIFKKIPACFYNSTMHEEKVFYFIKYMWSLFSTFTKSELG